jgi:hypothetical protein
MARLAGNFLISKIGRGNAMAHKKSPETKGNETLSRQKNHTREVSPNTKVFKMLTAFSKGSSLHRFQAEILGDHVLNTTISDLTKTHNLTFSKEWIEVPTRFNCTVRVKRYWLEGDELERARKLVTDSQED